MRWRCGGRSAWRLLRPEHGATPGAVWRRASARAGTPERIAAEAVVWADGVAASRLAASIAAPLDRAGRVLAEATLAVPGDGNLFIVGDGCALQQDGKPLPGVA